MTAFQCLATLRQLLFGSWTPIPVDLYGRCLNLSHWHMSREKWSKFWGTQLISFDHTGHASCKPDPAKKYQHRGLICNACRWYEYLFWMDTLPFPSFSPLPCMKHRVGKGDQNLANSSLLKPMATSWPKKGKHPGLYRRLRWNSALDNLPVNTKTIPWNRGLQFINSTGVWDLQQTCQAVENASGAQRTTITLHHPSVYGDHSYTKCGKMHRCL